MREMFVNPNFYNRKSFGCFDKASEQEGAEMPVVVLTREEMENIKSLLNASIKNPEECSSWLEEALEIIEGGGN